MSYPTFLSEQAAVAYAKRVYYNYIKAIAYRNDDNIIYGNDKTDIRKFSALSEDEVSRSIYVFSSIKGVRQYKAGFIRQIVRPRQRHDDPTQYYIPVDVDIKIPKYLDGCVSDGSVDSIPTSWEPPMPR